jgi:hypothetical protein
MSPKVIDSTGEVDEIPTWTGPNAPNIERARRLFGVILDGLYQGAEWVRMSDEATRLDCIDCAEELDQ